ncbi:MAG: LLM class flavin-dependent oxidoreductase [Sulfurimonas sp.]|jgi:alkanesulfonate monooxygenase SsuD/methylene tetrahydromethanopterin reductase-like flavin-dependent oxidoreductase (luciferase family)|nr:LLM class flavin-dependent oxidoreductase [Sulfurimonas sp.]
MKLGIFLLTENYGGPVHATIANDIELGVYAEELGFDEVWFAEHHFNAFSVIPNPTLMMATLAAKTKRIRIGSAAFLAPFYQSMRLAEEIATLDNLSFGRIDAGFAKGGFAYDVELFEKSPQNLRQEMFESVEKIDETLSSYPLLEPKPLQKKIPFYIATFSTIETIEFAAKHGYGLMFSQGATLEQCMEAQDVYKKVAGMYPQIVLMRVFCVDESYQSAYEKAMPVTDHFIKCMRLVQSRQMQPTFKKENYEALLEQRFSFFDGKNFLDNAILGDKEECVLQIQKIKSEIKNLHLILKVASANAMQTRKMLKIFSQEIKAKIQG